MPVRQLVVQRVKSRVYSQTQLKLVKQKFCIVASVALGKEVRA